MSDNSQPLKAKSGEVAAKVIDGEAILINLGSGLYYSMGEVGGRVWSLIEQGCSADTIAGVIAAEFEVDEQMAKADVTALVDQLLEEELVEVAASGNGAADVKVSAGGAAYAKPELKKFDDMAEMFALDPPLPGLAGKPEH